MAPFIPANDVVSSPPDERVWTVCAHMRGGDDQQCLRCPAWEVIGHHGLGTRACYRMAVGMINVVETGDYYREPKTVSCSET